MIEWKHGDQAERTRCQVRDGAAQRSALIELMENSVDSFGPIDEGIAQSPLATLHDKLSNAKREVLGT